MLKRKQINMLDAPGTSWCSFSRTHQGVSNDPETPGAMDNLLMTRIRPLTRIRQANFNLAKEYPGKHKALT